MSDLTTEIDYDHSANTHTVAGAHAALTSIFDQNLPKSLLDVGCGRGTWVRAALDLGIDNVFGLDGITIPENKLLVSQNFFHQQNLGEKWDLGRRFDVALCLEVAEHLEADRADTLISSVVKHSDVVFFSAAAPGQNGQHHVNCQWPTYWQELFNKYGYICDDGIRWKIWNNPEIEAWYRQNMFKAVKAPSEAGKEARIRPVIHPDMFMGGEFDLFEVEKTRCITRVEDGRWPISWYLRLLPKAGKAKLKRKINLSPDG